MAAPIQPDEPVIVYTVRSLIGDLREDMSRRFDDISKMLNDRVTIGTFRALASELDAARNRIKELEDWQTAKVAEESTKRRLSDRTLAWAAVIVALLTAIATLLWLWIGG